MSPPWRNRVEFAIADGKPNWERTQIPQGFTPNCSESCPHHDGKRCRLMGLRPQALCEPAVEAMSVLLEEVSSPDSNRVAGPSASLGQVESELSLPPGEGQGEGLRSAVEPPSAQPRSTKVPRPSVHHSPGDLIRELCAAAQNAVDWCCGSDASKNDGEFCEGCEPLVAAIAKAEGRA